MRITSRLKEVFCYRGSNVGMDGFRGWVLEVRVLRRVATWRRAAQMNKFQFFDFVNGQLAEGGVNIRCFRMVLLVHGLIIAQRLNAEFESERLNWQEVVKHCGKTLRRLQISWRSV